MQIKTVEIIIIIFLLFISVISWYFFTIQKTENIEQISSVNVSEIMSADSTAGFAKAIEPIEFQFPRDFASHPKFKNEWWYFTGNLKTEKGRLFGFQFTIFRNALTADSVNRKSTWATNQFYMGHFALTDVDGNKFYAFERFSRGAKELAGVQQSPLRIWLEDWNIEIVIDKEQPDVPTFFIKASEKNKSIDLKLQSTKPIVLQGNNGLSQKGPEPGNASYYYSFTRLKTNGTIQLENINYDVSGYAWLDREWSTSALGKDQVGWDWFSLQLDNRQEIMYYQISNQDGTTSNFSSGAFVEIDGAYRTFSKNNIELTILDHWANPAGIKYPSKWRMKLVKENIELEIIPNVANQELPLSIRYWEGSVSIAGKSNGQLVKGLGYVELTGYAQ